MGGHGHDGHEHFRVENEEDVLPARTLIVIAVVTIAIFTAGGLVAWAFLARYDRVHPAIVWQPMVMPREIHGIDQSLIWVDDSIQREIAEERRQLQSYGWVDRRRGIAHIPIDEAMRRVAQGAGQ